jgi:hypothetical protein
LRIKRNAGSKDSKKKKDLKKSKDDSNQKMILKKVLNGIVAEKRELESKRKANRNFGLTVFTIIATALAYQNVSMMMNLITISQLALTVEIGAILLILILIKQYVSLRGEIDKTTIKLENLETYANIYSDKMTLGLENLETAKHIYSNKSDFPIGKWHRKLYGKIFDVKKNTIDKLFDKLKTFSNTWLAIAGGLVSTILIEGFKYYTIDFHSVLVISLTALLIWDLAQNLYGSLNYELVKKTKDLAFWWIALV